jgi:hypothetical protein
MPKKHHTMCYKQHYHPKGNVGKPDLRIGEVVNVEQAKQEKKKPGKVRNSMK